MARHPDRDPGDAAPPGVAPVEPVPLGPEDRKIKNKLERVPGPDRPPRQDQDGGDRET